MYIFFAALVCAVLGTIPLFIARKIAGAITMGVISFVVLWPLFYCMAPSTVYPMFGLPGLFLFILWVIGGIIGAVIDEGSGFALSPAIIMLVLYVGSCIVGSEFMRTEAYQAMIGEMPTKEWTQEVQPKDPRHMRMSTRENALYLAQKAVGQDGSIGSQFQIEENELTLQMVNGELYYVAPLEFKGFFAWNSTSSSPGYIIVSAEDPEKQAQLVNFPSEARMQYSPQAFFGNDLERHLRNSGYLNKGLTDYSFELDEDRKPWWVVTVFEPTIMWDAEKVEGVVLVNPANGDSKFYAMGEIPEWVDRAVPQDYVKNYITWWGEYVHGYWNSLFSEKDVVKPGDSTLIYGEGGQPEWVTDITSSNEKDNSLVGLVYTNSRTGKSVFYKVGGGATNSEVLKAVDTNPKNNYRKVHGADPQLYNVYGSMACVVPLFNEAHSFQGVSIVPINSVQDVITGNNQNEAMRSYQKWLSDKGEKVAVEKDRDLVTTQGEVDRIQADNGSSGTLYYIHLPGIPHLFTGGSGTSPKLPVTKPGDRVKITYYNSPEDVLPLSTFDNLSLVLSESKEQKEVRQAVETARARDQAKEDAHTVRVDLQNMSDEELQKMKQHMSDKTKPQ